MILTTFPPLELPSSDVSIGSVATLSSTIRSIHDSIDMLQQLVTDGVLYLAYGIAILCGFKFILYLINGITSNTRMGARSVDDSPFFRGTNRIGASQIPAL